MSRFHPFAVSGLKITYHLDKDEGERVSDVTKEDGGKLQNDTLYTLIYRGSFSGRKSEGVENGITMTDVLRNYVIAKERIAPDTKRECVKKSL